MAMRQLISAALLAALGYWLAQDAQQARLAIVNGGFLDFLLSNARGSLVPAPSAAPEVVHIELRQSDSAEYASWPPAAVDYQLMIKAIRAAKPSAVLFAAEFSGGDPAATESLAELLLDLPCVFSAPMKGATGGDAGTVPTLAGATTHAFPVLNQIYWPQPALSRLGDVGLADGSHWVFADKEGQLRCSSVLLTLLRAKRCTLAESRLKLGAGARLLLPDGLCLPLQPDSSLLSEASVPSVNALDLMTLDSLSPAEQLPLKQALGEGRVVVLSTTAAEAKALQHALSIPRHHSPNLWQQWAAWGLAGLLGSTLVYLPKRRAISRSMLYLLAALVLSLLAFQLMKLWCPPAVPAALIAAGGLLGRLLGRTEG
jgi:hypothetical protein